MPRLARLAPAGSGNGPADPFDHRATLYAGRFARLCSRDRAAGSRLRRGGRRQLTRHITPRYPVALSCEDGAYQSRRTHPWRDSWLGRIRYYLSTVMRLARPVAQPRSRKGYRMTRVFVSHCSEDYYFVDFLTELLKFHHVDVWVDRSSLEAGGEFPSDIEQALATCGALIIVISQHSPKSQWMAREVSHFRAVNADRPVIPLVLDAAADPDKVYEGLGVITQLRFYESFLEGFRKLLQLLGRNLFPYVENRQIPDRRSAERRVSGDRRKNPVRRLRVALDDYVESTGRDLLEPMNRWREVGLLVQDLVADDSPLQSFDFVDKKTGEQVRIESSWLERRALNSWRSKSEKYSGWGVHMRRQASENITGAAYIIDDVIDGIMNTYIVTSKNRRSGERRSCIPRRSDQN